MNISSRAIRLNASPIRKLVSYANEAKKKGKKIYHLNIGQPDIPTSPDFFKAMRAYDEKVVAYGDSKGDPNLIDAICKYYDKFNAGYKPEHVYITNGASEALILAIESVCDPGDEVLLFEPFYANYSTFVTQASVRVVTIDTCVENGYRLPSMRDIERNISSNTRAIIVTNPGNPTGVVLTKEEIECLKTLALRYDLALIVDEVYREFCYDGEFQSFASIRELDNNLIMIDSVSKRFSACGARIGCVICKVPEFNEQIMKFCQARLCCPTIEMYAATALYSTSDEYFEDMKKEYQKRRDTLCEALAKLDDVVYSVPQGAFYAMIRLPVDDAEKFAIWMLQEFDVDGETMMFAPGNGFYSNLELGVDEVRLAYVLKSEDLEKAIYILGEALKVYPGRK